MLQPLQAHPRPGAADLLDAHAGEQTCRRVGRREVLVGAQHHLGQLLEQFGSATLDDPRGARDRQIVPSAGRAARWPGSSRPRAGRGEHCESSGTRRGVRRRARHRPGWTPAPSRSTETCGLPSGLSVTRVASVPSPMSSRAASLSFMRCSTAARAVSFPSGGLEVEQRRLGQRAADVLAGGPVGPHHAVAWDHHRKRIVGAGGADGAHGAGVADRRRRRSRSSPGRP